MTSLLFVLAVLNSSILGGTCSTTLGQSLDSDLQWGAYGGYCYTMKSDPLPCSFPGGAVTVSCRVKDLGTDTGERFSWVVYTDSSDAPASLLGYAVEGDEDYDGIYANLSGAVTIGAVASGARVHYGLCFENASNPALSKVAYQTTTGGDRHYMYMPGADTCGTPQCCTYDAPCATWDLSCGGSSYCGETGLVLECAITF